MTEHFPVGVIYLVKSFYKYPGPFEKMVKRFEEKRERGEGVNALSKPEVFKSFKSRTH